LLDMFVQSAEKERGSPSQLSDRVLPSRKAEQAEETVPGELLSTISCRLKRD
jgi:hypothetical protein